MPKPSTLAPDVDAIPKLLADVLGNLSDVFILTDRNFCYLFVNKAAEEMLKKKSSDLFGKSFMRVFPGANRHLVFKEAQEAIKTRRPSRFEYFATKQNVWWDVRIYATKDTVAFHMRNISSRKIPELNSKFLAEASKELSSSLDFQTTLNTVANMAVRGIADWCGIDMLAEDGFTILPIAVAHKDPKKVKWAKEYREQHPINMDSDSANVNIIKSKKSEIYPTVTDEMLKAASKTKKEYELAKSLSLRSVMIVPIVVRKKAIGVISFITSDINRKYNERDLEMAEELAQRAATSIENALLYEESQKAINLRDEFISIASHELKTPLTSLKVYVQILDQSLRKSSMEKEINYLQKIDSQLDKLNRLIKDLLDVSKVQRGKLEFNEETFVLNDLVGDLVDAIQPSAETHKINFKAEKRVQIYGDKDRIGQIIINLLSNAIKYSLEANKVDVTLKQEGKKVLVAVRDYGIGIDKKDLDKIFERFFQAHDPKDKTYPGLGIGLYISSEIAQRHGGRINVESKKGKGSTFTLVLPLKKAKTA